jgi:hypothetical protein
MSEPKLEDCDRSQELELEDSIESVPLNPKHSGFMSVSGDLPTPPFRHPSEEGIFMREIMLLGFIIQPNLQILSRPIFND